MVDWVGLSHRWMHVSSVGVFMLFDIIVLSTHGIGIILPAKSRSDVMFCLQSYGTYLS